jgi:hypothetical protein
MSFKKMETNFSFADISLFPSLKRNQAIKRMQQINAIVDWGRIEIQYSEKLDEKSITLK